MLQQFLAGRPSSWQGPDSLLELYKNDAFRGRKLLTKAEEAHFGRLIQSKLRGAGKARQRLIEGNLRLVIRIARQFDGRGLPLMDLIQEGNLGLMHAVMKYNPATGYRFSTYAVWWIRQAMQRALSGSARLVRVPVHVLEKQSKALKTMETYRQKEYRGADIVDVARETNGNLKRLVVGARGAAGLHIISLDQQGKSDIAKPMALVEKLEIGVKRESPADDEQLSRLILELRAREQRIVIRRFGLDGEEPATLEILADELGMTRERIRQIEAEALKYLRGRILGHRSRGQFYRKKQRKVW